MIEAVKRLVRTIIPVLVVSLLIIVGWLLIRQADFAVLAPQGEIADQQKTLLLFTLGLSLIVVIPVFVMLFLFAWKFREGNTKADYQPNWSKNTKLEALWWGIPIVIIAVLAVVTWQTSHALDPYRKLQSDKPALEVQVVALQWKWLFIYPEEGIATVNNLTIPVDRPVHFTMTADAPMSAFWVPKLGSQIYSMNGMSSQLNLIANKSGTYQGYNTNINGKGYADMNFSVPAMNQNDFDTWVKQTKSAKNTMVLNELTYQKLAKPSVEKTKLAYRLADSDIYDTIVMKYMHGDMKSTDEGIQKGEPHPMDHSGHDMSEMGHE